jgi:hypothetical protein
MFVARKKKDVFRELATSLFLMKELVFHPKASGFMSRLIERASEALTAALPYTGVFDARHVRQFMEAKPQDFTIDCGTDIIQSDTIRFVESIIDNRRKPPRIFGKRGITADVLAVDPPHDNPMLRLHVLACGGVWDIEPGTEIRRSMKSIIQFDIRRCPWDDESKRAAIKCSGLKPDRPADKTAKQLDAAVTAPLTAPPTTLGRYDALRGRGD